MRTGPRLAGAVVAVALCALAFGASAGPVPAAVRDDDPAKSCRAEGPGAAELLPIVEPIVHKYLGEHPKSVTSGVALGIVTPTPGLPGEPQVTLVSCGVTALGGTEPITPDSVFEIGSESKLFTAIALARMVLAGEVDLDDPLQGYLPVGYSAPTAACGDPTGRSITLRDLATHNSGLVKNPKNVTWSETNPQGHQNYDRAHLWNSFTHGYPETCDPMLFSPGEGYSYSNWGFALLGTVLADQRAPGGAVPDYADLVADLVTGPLDMTATELEVISPAPGMVEPVCPVAVTSPCQWDNTNAFAGAGGLVSTIEDMATFVTANLGFAPDPVMGPALALTHEPAGQGPTCVTCMGLGWTIAPPGTPTSPSPLTVLEKDGGTWGMHSQTYLVPEACWGLTLLSNADESFVVGREGIGGQVLAAIGPTADAGPCAAPVPPTTTTTTSVPATSTTSSTSTSAPASTASTSMPPAVVPLARPASAVVEEPHFTG